MPLRAKNGRWEYRFKLHGERVTKLTDLEAIEENRTRAEKLEQKHRDSILKGEETARRQPRRGFTEASKEFMQHVNLDEKPSTAKRVETSLASLRLFFGDRHLTAIRPPDVKRYAVWRQTGEGDIQPVRPITLRHDLDNLSKFFVWAIGMDLATVNPVSEVEKPSADDAIRMHILTAAEEFEYFHRCKEDKYGNLADVARLILDQGMRPDEVMTLECRGVDLEAGRVTIFIGKTKAARRSLKLTPECRLIVERRLGQANGSPWLFPSPKKPGRPLTKLNTAHDAVCAADPERGRKALSFVLYDLRHTFATRAAESRMPLPTLAAILGHSSLRMITRYVHPQQEHMDAEMERLSRPVAVQAETRKEQVQ